MEWKLFEECKGHSWECDIHELKDLGGGRGFLFISRGCGGREGIERFVKNVPRNSHYPPPKIKETKLCVPVVSYDESR